MNVEDIELGNLMFNPNITQSYTCPEYFVALLREINRVLHRVMWNINQEEYDSPFENTGNVFECPVFKVEAYNWDESISQDYNFIYFVDKTKANIDDVKVSWYKYLGRDTTINQDLDYSILVDVFNNCITYLKDFESEKLEEREKSF